MERGLPGSGVLLRRLNEEETGIREDFCDSDEINTPC